MSGLPTTQRVLYLLGPERVELRSVAVPRPGPEEVLLRVEAATTCGTDFKVWRRGGHPRMLTPPCPFGHEVAGVVAAVGAGVVGFAEGDPVVVANSAPCGECPACRAGRENLCRDLRYLNGAYGEYLLLPPRFVARSTRHRPASLDPAVAALAEPLACVRHGLSACPDGPEPVLVLGGGPIGQMFVGELAREGRRVVLADPSERRRDVARALGASSVVEVAGIPDDARRLADATSPEGVALVVEATGVPAAWETAMAVVAPGGTVVLFGGCPPGTTVRCDAARVHYDELTVKGVYHHRPATFAEAVERLADGDPGYGLLIEEERPLEQVELALRRMAAREILKAAIRP